jgi:hypothetical protein
VLRETVRKLFPQPLVQVEGSAEVDLVVNRQAGRLLVHLVNTAGPHRDEKRPIFESVPEVGPLSVTVRCESRPAKVTLEPGAQPLAYEHRNGTLTFQIAQLDLYRIVVIE